ncbi:TetR family transcriptional regulator [Pseudonocardia sp. DSM 110487]|uniref:TetR/AcrR family transcriptional regulator n=1 Tax=Pseudonocardia sp. DSM 110487 TaxID=2865833 RepID=UPI001C6982AC|nr:TetR/AcrR family transcriptional regulator [Pseudonocardia sp. DSM 110487]QYN38040.1 TetR family transcriptional regulator [Pseudonocardia sp. DSM 110487]
MARLTRAQAQERTRERVLAAARTEFVERGFRDAKIDVIAERAELTRGAVYSNFPGKRALYLAVLAAEAERAPIPEVVAGTTARTALGAFARAWAGRMPLPSDDPDGTVPLGADLLPEVLADERMRTPFAQLMALDAILLGLALEQMHGPSAAGRRVRAAEVALTTLHGASQLAAAAPGFADPFDVVSACEGLSDLELGSGRGDEWAPPHLPYVPRARPAGRPWEPPAAIDAVRGTAARLTGDGVVAVLGLHRLVAVEEAVRAAPPGSVVTAVLVSGEPGELASLARLVVADVCRCIRLAFPESAWPRLQVVHDETGAVAAAAGERVVSDATEVAVRVAGRRIVAHAEGRGACHAAASA